MKHLQDLKYWICSSQVWLILFKKFGKVGISQMTNSDKRNTHLQILNDDNDMYLSVYSVSPTMQALFHLVVQQPPPPQKISWWSWSSFCPRPAANGTGHPPWTVSERLKIGWCEAWVFQYFCSRMNILVLWRVRKHHIQRPEIHQRSLWGFQPFSKN